MNTSIIIFGSILMLGLIFCLSLIYSKVHWLFKALVIVSTLLISFGVYSTYKQLLGFPSSAKMPDNAKIIWAGAKEPNPKLNDKGAVYYIIIVEKDNILLPKLFELPYSKQQHGESSKAEAMLKEGKQPKIKTKSKESFSEYLGYKSPQYQVELDNDKSTK